MGSITFDFLTESFLFRDDLLSERYSNISEAEIRKELQKYREHCTEYLSQLIEEVRASKMPLKVFRGKDRKPTLAQLRQSAFYLDQYVLDDPLFRLTEPTSETKKVMSDYLGFMSDHIDKTGLASTISFLKQLTPMVSANFVKIVPASYFFELPEKLPFYYSENAFADILPAHLMSFLRDRAIVGCLREAPEGGMILESSLYPSRKIHVRFGNDDFGSAMMFQLLKIDQIDPIEKDNSFGMHMTRSTGAPDTKYFEYWVNQSVNRAAGDKCDRLVAENTLAAELNATYVTTSELDFEVLQQIVPETDKASDFIVKAMMELNLSSLENIDIENLMRIRTEEHDAFQNFRSDLNKKLFALRFIEEPEKLKTAAENLNQELSELHLRKLDGIIRDLHKKIFCDAAVIVSSLVASTHAGGYGIPLVATAIANGMKSIQEYRSKRKDNPLFFLWKLQKSARK